MSSNSSGRGGGERYLVFLTQGLRHLGYDVVALLSTASYMDYWAVALANEGATVRRVALKGLRDRPLRFVQALADSGHISRVADFCKVTRPAAIVVNQQYDEDGLDYLAGALAAGIAPVAGVMHMPMTRTKRWRRLGMFRGALLARWYCHHPYRAVFVSEGARQEFEDYYEYPRPTFVVNNGISFPDRRENLTTSRLFAGACPTLGFVGQLVPQKNLRCLINSWLQVRREGYECSLLLVGDGPERTSLEQSLWRSAPPGSWYITGWTTEPESWLTQIDVFVLTSHYEGLSLSLLEAAGRGIPSVIPPVNGAAEVAASADWVRLAESNAQQHIAAALCNTFRDLVSLKRAAEVSAADFREQFSTTRMARELLRVLGVGAFDTTDGPPSQSNGPQVGAA